MKYSENAEYLEYIARKSRGDLEGAKRALLECLNHVEAEGNHIQVSDLLQRIGHVLFEQGDSAGALEYYEKSESSAPTSLLAPYYYAKFLAETVKDYDRAIAKCDSIISKATATHLDETDEDYGSATYIRMATELKQACLRAKQGS